MMRSGLADLPAAGLVVIDKPAGWTSHSVVGRVRRLAGTRKVGHAGTLDPMATGVLIIGIGKATRLLGYLALADKAYSATIRLGISTVTDDAEGEVMTAVGAEGLKDSDIEAAMARLRGDLLQVPSAVSAIKVDGVRSYARVRAGDQVDLPARPVQVERFISVASRASEVSGVRVLDLDVEVECSTGTYVRALARDLGSALGVGGHLTALQRTRVGPFRVDEAQTLDEVERALRILPLDRVVQDFFPVLTVSEVEVTHVQHGRRLVNRPLPDSTTALVNEAGHFLALYRQEGPDAVAEIVLV
jgi:tRNA pseudouridine55 synthase